MEKTAGFWYKFKLLVNLGLLLLVSLLHSFGRGARKFLLYFTGRFRPASQETGLLVNTYELMKERLRDSIREMEEKTRQLEETGEQLRHSRDFLQSIIDSLDEELIVLDSDLLITDVNRNFRIKYRDRDIIGRHCYEVMYGLKEPCRPPLRDCPASQVWQTGTPLRFSQHQDGAGGGKYYEKTLFPLYDRRGNIIRVVEMSRDVTESKELEKKILEANQELQSKEQMREQLLRRIISAQEDERQRVARELHDVTSQALATLGVGLEVIATPEADARERGTRMEGIKSLLSATSKDVHRLIYDLRPSLLDDLGLSAAIRSYAHTSLDAAGVEVHVEVAGQEKRLPPAVEIALFRIVQEAIANIARHARAESAYISLEFKENGVAVEIEDDGIGFDHSGGFAANAGGQGVGLLGMQERAELLGGRLIIDTRPSGGTRVSVEVPVKFEADNGRDKSSDS